MMNEAQCSRGRPVRSNADAKAATLRLLCQLRELALSHMDQCRMIAAFDVDLRLFINAFINDEIERIASADRGNGAGDAISEQLRDFIFSGESRILTKLRPQLWQADVVRSRENRKHIAAVAA